MSIGSSFFLFMRYLPVVGISSKAQLDVISLWDKAKKMCRGCQSQRSLNTELRRSSPCLDCVFGS